MSVEKKIEPAAASQAILSVQNLVVRYDSTIAVRDVSFQVNAGEVFGLLGPNGAGKTSILSVIEGLVQPHSGDAYVAGFCVKRDARSARANLGVQLQASSFQADLNVREILRLFSGLYGVSTATAAIDAVLSEFGLTAVAGKKLAELSGGQQQSVSLATATLHHPPFLLLDEPTTGLDPHSRRKLWERVRSMRDQGCGIVLTTHSMEEAHAVCDRIAIIDCGTLVAMDTPQGLIETYRDDPAVRSFAQDGTTTLEDVFIGLTTKEPNFGNR